MMAHRTWRSSIAAIIAAAVPAAAQTGAERPITVAGYYFGNYHPGDPRNVKNKGAGWSEWELVKAARPRFPGHHQPNVPRWGYLDESDPRVMEQKIAAAAEFRAKARAAGLPGVHLNAVVWGQPILPGEKTPVDAARLVRDLGFDSVTSYVWIHHAPLPKQVTDYDFVRDRYFNCWNEWTEGSYLEPDVANGMKYLEAVRDVFGAEP
jgi:hypothetical protein